MAMGAAILAHASLDMNPVETYNEARSLFVFFAKNYLNVTGSSLKQRNVVLLVNYKT